MASHDTMPNRPTFPRLTTLVRSSASVALLALLVASANADEGRLGTAKLQKAATACQKLVAQLGAKVQAGKLAALDACGQAALVCVQSKQADAGCLPKAGQSCAKKLAAASAAFAKAKSKIVAAKSCSVELGLADLMSSDGLGYGGIVGACEIDFGVQVCGGIEPLAECLLRARDHAAGAQYGEALPRTAELLDLLPTSLPSVSGLPDFPGCDDCSVAPGARQGVEQCGKAVTKAVRGLTASLDKVFAGCAQKVFACVQTKGTEACLAGAAATCDKGAAAIDAAFAKLGATVAKKCGASVDFAALANATGLNLGALGGVCPTTPASADELATCLQQRTACATAGQARHAFARLEDLAANGRLGALGSRVGTSCPPVASILQARTVRGGRVFFGSMTKFMKLIRRPKTGALATLKPGVRPATTPGVGKKVTSLGGPARITLGGMTKVPFRYKIGGGRSAAASARLAEELPKFLFIVQREDVDLEDHFEIELDPAPVDEIEVEDEIEITYQDTIPGCAFTLALATQVGGEVSEDTPLLQAVDVPPPPPPGGGPITQVIGFSGDGVHGLTGPVDVAVDGLGNLYAAGYSSNNVFRVTPAGAITQIIDATGDGQGNALNAPNAVAVDGLGNVYVVGQGSDNAFRIAPGGVITEIIDASGDGVHALDFPQDVAVDGARNVYVSGLTSNNVFKITPGGTITQVIDATGDGAGNPLGSAYGVAADATGNAYVNGIISAFKIDTGGAITLLIDSTGDGAGNTFTGQGPIAVDGTGNVYAASALMDRVFKITPEGTKTVAIGPNGDGAGHAFKFPFYGLAADASGNAYVTGGLTDNAFVITAAGVITQIIDATGDGKGNIFLAAGGIAATDFGTVYAGSATGVFRITPN